MSRPKGARNVKPSREAIQGYYRLLSDAADNGDTQAAAELIKLHHLTNQTDKETTHG
ncbi:MAG: hypothetical protein U9Q35_03085 [Pseudomonadota bacterium]|nr:hypothetical protein [Pseudomonadota bacterium]